MKNKKGFTLVELLSVMAVLAIILGIVSASYIGIKKYIRASFYKTLEESILVSGGEYFSYNEKPLAFGDEKNVSLKSLTEGKYITEVLDQKGKSCDLDNSYVTAYKNSSDKSDYYVCLKCTSDNYPNDSDKINEACNGNISYKLRMIATIGNTSKLYKEGEYTNKNVKLTFQTYNDIEKVEIKENNIVIKTCNMTNKNGLRSCSVEINASGKYEYYGVTGENQTKSEEINILIDKVKPEFKVYDLEALIEGNTVLKAVDNNTTNIIVNVKDIKDLDSGIKTIKYTFDSNYTNIDRTKQEFKVEKELNLGKTNLKIEVSDYAGNVTTRVITYEVYKKVEKPDTTYCNTLTYNGENQTLTKENSAFTFSNNIKMNAGTYEVLAKLKENYRWSDGTNLDIKINCSIAKKDVTIQASNQTITGNGNLNQSVNQVTITGLVTGDKLESIKLTESGGIETGNIVPSEAVIKRGSNVVTSNYNITYQNGTYTKDIKVCANIYLNGSTKIGNSTADMELCCNSSNGSSCNITLPTITPKSGFTSLGYSDDGENLTSANYQVNQSVTIYKPSGEDNQSFYAITRSTNRNSYGVTFDLNGATSYTTGGSTYTTSKKFTCNADYAYNGEELPDECGITLPTITRSGWIVYGWSEDASSKGATYNVNQVITLHDDIELFAITSKNITLSYDTNSTTSVTTDNLTSKSETKTIYNTDGAMFNIPSYDNGKVCRNNGGDKYHGYQLLGLATTNGSNVEFCFGDQIYLETDKTLYLVWQDKYATAVGNVSNNLRLRSGPGTSYSQIASISKGDPVYITSANYTWNGSDKHTWYPVIYGAKVGYAAGNTSNNSTLKNLTLTSTPNADSCSYAYSCSSNNKLLSITPSDVVLNITSNTSKQKMQQTLSIANQCGPMASATSSDSSVVTATTGGVIKAVSGSVAVNQTKSAVVTYTTKYGCSENVNVLVKNTEAVAPDIAISVSGDSSTCSGSYIKGATATVTCKSDLPITSYSAKIGSTSYNSTSSGNTMTSTINLSSTGTKTINVTCSNSEGTSTISKSVSVKVKSSSSACGCSSRYTISNVGTSCSRCTSWYVSSSSFQSQGSLSSLKTRCYTAGGTFRKSYNYNCVNVSGNIYKCDSIIYKCSEFACKSYNTCCHT